MSPNWQLIQDDYIYDLEWMGVADNLFIEVLVDQQLIGNFKAECVNAHALLIAQDAINKEMNKSFTYGYIEERLRVLKKRYQVFYWVLRKHGVRYDEITNRVSAPDHVWDEILREDEFGLAYQEYGDPKWPELQQLFGSLSTNFPQPEIEIIKILFDGESDNIGNVDGLPKPPNDNGVINISSSRSSKDRSFWEYLEQFGPCASSGSEGSVNQPVKPRSPSPYPGPPFYHSPARVPRPPRPYVPSPNKSVDTSGSSAPLS
ncbi:hypothetical protein DH2020_035830 [Rehmannia glutinosa]|uniref:Myb/SANT-like domain-containing protein n=1 Tax=Rehmannia glutinosa TaxID=99300 RepID=A0ABR0V8W2_REHGL